MRLRAHRIWRAQKRVSLALAVLLAALTMAPANAGAARSASYEAVVAQIEHGPVIRAVINPSLRHVEIKFRDSSEWLAVYPRGAQARLQRLLHRRQIRVVFASHHRPKPKPVVHHELRYVAAGVLVAVLAAVGLVVALDSRSRRGGAPTAQTPPG